MFKGLMKLLTAAILFALSLNSFAQNHMVEFKVDSLLLGDITYSKDKNRGRSVREDVHSSFYLNFARSISDHVQVGLQGNYNHRYSESYSALLGAIYNFDSDKLNTLYASLYSGWLWGYRNDESFITKVSLGRRFSLSRFNLDTVTYSPEVSFVSATSTKATSHHDWSQDLQIKFLQFAFFW